MKIKIIAIDLSTSTDKKGKPYQIVEVSFKNLTFNKVESRKIMPFGATTDTSKLLAKAQAGEFYEIEVVKNAAGFNDWISATKVEEGETAPAPRGTLVSASLVPAMKSTYETPEERAKKQVYIVRQSSITAALTFLSKSLHTEPLGRVTTDNVIAVAKEFENYVFGIVAAQSAAPVALEDMDDDIPN